MTRNVAYSCDDTYSLVPLLSAGFGICLAPEWTEGLPNRAFELRAVRGIDFRIRLGVAWNKEDPTASRDDIVDIARWWEPRHVILRHGDKCPMSPHLFFHQPQHWRGSTCAERL
uniref:LysR substrate-binding domain-containing protein n=1 Tax=Rhizobium leguminosarum TaxID=384 RepID=A0A179BDG8_RHILE|nr:hypothetical protein A4U53_32895 [Rhizobium leguminosarum]